MCHFLCSLGTPGPAFHLTIDLVGTTTALFTYDPPQCLCSAKAVVYQTKYRIQGHSHWNVMTETSSLAQTVTKLAKHSLYEFTVVAKYVGGQFGPATKAIVIRTSKCCCCNKNVLSRMRWRRQISSYHIISYHIIWICYGAPHP